ncbi:MAG: four helix bundle protein [Bacteroidales bacterium]|jgi:hypothetical protein|nr:four helix bundle protein [Bacteroidales bacterium]MCI1784931.1 four helix bundle protein [Bacteroidales bacterium]
MAVYENLPVFKVAYDLMVYMYQMCGNLNRLYRYSIGERIEMELMDLLLDIYRANSNEDKISFLRNAREKVTSIKLCVRLLHDTKQISLKRFSYISEQMESVSKQLTAWYKKCNKGIIKQ